MALDGKWRALDEQLAKETARAEQLEKAVEGLKQNSDGEQGSPLSWKAGGWERRRGRLGCAGRAAGLIQYLLSPPLELPLLQRSPLPGFTAPCRVESIVQITLALGLPLVCPELEASLAEANSQRDKLSTELEKAEAALLVTTKETEALRRQEKRASEALAETKELLKEAKQELVATEDELQAVQVSSSNSL